MKHWLRSDAKSGTFASDDLMALLGIMVFRCENGKRYRRISPVPVWMSSFVAKDFVIGDARDLPFDFLGVFLDECDDILEKHKPINDIEEIWHEHDLSGTTRSFSIQLYELSGQPHLLLRCLDDSFAQKQDLYQRAREQKLALDALAKAEAALRESKQRLELIMRQAPAIFWCTDVDGILTYHSGSAVDALKCRYKKCVGRSVLEIFHNTDTPQDIILSSHEIAVAGEAATFVTCCAERSFDVRVEPLYDDSGKNIVGTSGVCVESTERVKAEANAVAALQAKTDFVTGISHEIRTPMNAIIGLTELALDQPLKKEQEVYLQSAVSASESLLNIIDQLLDFSRIEKGSHDLENREFSLNGLVYDVLSGLAVHAHSKGIELVSVVEGNIPEFLRGDSGRLRQILVNLVGNAIKFTITGEVRVHVKIEPSNMMEPNMLLHFAVCDTGIGVLPEKQELIFDAFRQAETSTIRKYGGTGLGLSIASELTRLLGGQIWIVSPGKSGAGSEFHFTVMMSRAVSEPVAGSSVIPEEGMPSSCILVGVEGSSLDSTYRLLAGIAGDVAEISVAAGETEPISIPAVDVSGVLVLELPAETNARKSLLDSLKGVRESSSSIVAISPVGIPPMEMEDLGTFCDSVLLKPISIEELRIALLNRDTVVKESDPKIPGEAFNRLRIIVADDNELNQWVIASICRNRGHEVTLVSNGSEAVRLTKRRRFDVMLLDIKMPDIDGYEVTRRIRQEEKSGSQPNLRLPIIALTAHIRSGTKGRCLAAGMDGYLLKPVRLRALFSMIEKVLAVDKSGNLISRADKSEALDMDKLEKLTAGNGSMQDSVLEAAENLLGSKLQQIEESLQIMDFESIKGSAERIGNMAAEIGANDLATSAASLKHMAEIQDIDGARARLIELQSESDRLSRHSIKE